MKNVFFKLNFQDKDHLDANFFNFVLAIWRECLPYQFIDRGIRMHILILTGVQK